MVGELNADPSIHGILVQLPLPKHFNSDEIIQSILPEKDVDGLSVLNAGKLATGDLATGLISCTPAGAMLLVRSIHGEDLSGLNAVVIGRSNLFGKPMGQLLLNANATVTMAHSRTKDLATVCKTADILVAAVGRAAMVKGDWVKPGATVIDVGINRIPAPEKVKANRSWSVTSPMMRQAQSLLPSPRSGRRRPDDDCHVDGQHRHRRLSRTWKDRTEVLKSVVTLSEPVLWRRGRQVPPSRVPDEVRSG